VPVLLQIALGGALGAMARYLAVRLCLRLFGADFPWGTLAVNVVGGFAMGIAVVLLAERPEFGLQRLAPFVMPGVLGGFTTFSAFSLETVQLAEQGRTVAAAAYVGASVALSLGALAIGLRLARSWGGA
jgi:CrcB protein